MRHKKWIVFCLAALLLLALCGCAGGETQALPQLIIGCDNYEPYNYTDADGEPAGMDVDLAREACARMGYEPVFRQIDWNERDALLADGEVDCLWSCYAMDGQEDAYAWAGPYMRSRQVVAVLEDSPIQDIGDLTGKSVAVRVGSKAERIFLGRTEKEVPQLRNVYTLNTMDEVVTALRNDYVDAIAGYAAAVREVLEHDGIAYRFLSRDLSYASLGVAFAKHGDTTAQQALSRALEEMRADGTTAQILQSYGVDTRKALGGLSDG